MDREARIKNAFCWMAYGDAIGFLYENTGQLTPFKEFHIEWGNGIRVQQEAGDSSDLFQLFIILTKGLLDDKEAAKVKVDYKRFREELKLFQYYRHGNPVHILSAIERGKVFETCEEYKKDVRGYGISRVISIILANKNFNTALVEIYKNTVILNRHPQIIITAQLIGKLFHSVINDGKLSRRETLQGLKDYLIVLNKNHLLEEGYDVSYSIAFERERINYIQAFDRLMKDDIVAGQWCCRNMLLIALVNYFRLIEDKGIDISLCPPNDIKETLIISYGLAGLVEGKNIDEFKKLSQFMFISTMSDYIIRLRNYNVGKKPYRNELSIDLFTLQTGAIVKHNVFNNVKILKREETKDMVKLYITSKTGKYRLIKQKAINHS